MRRTTDTVPDTSTVTMTRDRCEEFVQELYAEHGALLLRYAARLLGGDWHRAEDVLQEAAVRAWKHAPALEMNVIEARPWLYTVVKNLVIDHHRARKIRPAETLSLELLHISVADGTERLLTSQIVLDALAELTDQHREIIKLMYYLECSVAQVSAHLSIPAGTVKSRSYYALRALRKALSDRGVTRQATRPSARP